MFERMSYDSVDLIGDQAVAAAPLLISKLAPPLARNDAITRPELLQLLNQAEPQRVVLIAAPAGFGKTTLLSEWARQARQLCAWVTLDAGDNDRARFGAYVTAALNQIHPGIGTPIQAMLQSPQPVPLEWGITILLNAIAARPDPVALLLDDCHTITTPAIYQALSFLIDHLPANLTLILAGRATPPLPLARLRARRQLTELRADALRFTASETGRLVAALGLRLSEHDIALLTARTEGWVAGICLAARSLEGQPSSTQFIESLSGSNRFIADYLIDEVLSQQPGAVQDFLLQTSVLSRLSEALCDAVTGAPNSQTMLETLEDANLLIPLDADRRWYRHHQAFAEFFRARLERTQPARIPALHERAAIWFVDHALLPEAVDHALASGDIELAIHLIAQVAEASIQQGEIATLRRWLNSVPVDVIQRHPQLCLWYAWVKAAAFQPDLAEHWLHNAEQAAGMTSSADVPARLDMPGIVAQIAAVRVFIAMIRGDMRLVSQLGQAALAQLPGDRTFLRRVVTTILDFSTLFAEAQAGAQPLLGDSQRTRSDVKRRTVQYYASLYRLRGQLHAARAMYQHKLALTDQVESDPIFGGAFAQLGLAAIFCEQYELHAAQELVQAGLGFGRAAEAIPLIIDGMVTVSALQEARGDTAGALAALEDLERYDLAHVGLPDDMLRSIQAHKVRLWLALGHVAAAAGWVYAYEGETSSHGTIGGRPNLLPYVAIDFALARVYIAQQRFEPAQQLLEAALVRGQQQQKLQVIIEALILHACLSQAQGDLPQATASLSQALALGEPEGYTQIFVREGEALLAPLASLRALIRAQPNALPAPPSPNYIDRLLELLRSDRLEPMPATLMLPINVQPESVGVEIGKQLSARELQVLRLLAAGLSNQELAQSLIVSIATVKTHLIHIYSKLNARTRTEAVARARALRLI